MERREIITYGIMGVAAAAIPAVVQGQNADRFRVPEWGLRRRFVDGAFGRLAYLDEGQGDPALFLHGYPLSGFQWRHAVEQLALTNRCIVPDFLGLGASEASAGQDLSPPAQMTLIIKLLDMLGVSRVHVVANDSGGAVGQLLAAYHPDRVRSLLLTNCDTERQSPPPAMRPVIALARQGLYIKQWIEPWYENRQHARAADQFGGMCYADPAHPTDQAIEMYFGPLLSTPARARQVEAHAIAQETNALTGTRQLLKRYTGPTRIVWGMGDIIFNAANADFLSQSFGNSRGVRRLEKSKLFWPEERPDVIVEEATALWQQTAAEGVAR